MNSLYVTSIEEHSGKTATCLALAKQFQALGKNVGYMKPLSFNPWRIGNHIADEDAAFVKEVLGLPENPWELSSIIVTPGYLENFIEDKNAGSLFDQTISKVKAICQTKDILIVEGSNTLREGFVFGVNSLEFAKQLCCQILVLIKYRDEIHLLDDAISAKQRLGQAMCGIIVNRVPENANEFINHYAIPYLEHNHISVYGVIPETPYLAAITVGELVTALNAQILTKNPKLDAQVEVFTVGAMTADAALSRFRKQLNKGVITGGDRTDIQLAALETSTTCLILTGNLHPSPLIIKQAEEYGVSILLVTTNTMETIEAIERVFGKTRLGQPVKLKEFETLFCNHVDFNRLVKEINIDCK